MKENTIQFKSYSIYDIIMNDEESILGEFHSCFDDSSSKIKIKAIKTNEDPIEIIPWGQRLFLPSRLISKPFAVQHPYLGRYTFIIEGFETLSRSKRKVPLLYKMLKMAKIKL